MKRTIVLALGALVMAYGLAIVSLNGANAQTAHPGPTTEQAKVDTGIDVQRLEVELAAFVWRSYPHFTVNARCPGGYICTLHEGDNVIRVYTGDNVVRNVFAGTFRHVSSYPSSDAVHRPCELLRKEQEFGARETPSFPVHAGNFSCSGGEAPVTVAQPAPAPAPAPSACPTEPWQVATEIGGREWMSLAGTNGRGWLTVDTPTQVRGADGWVVHTPTFPVNPGLPVGKTEDVSDASGYCLKR